MRIDLTVPGHEYVINHKASPDLSLAVREAFDAARRKLDEFVSATQSLAAQ